MGALRRVGVAGAGVATAALALTAQEKGRINPEEGLRQGAAQGGSGAREPRDLDLLLTRPLPA